MAHLNASSAAGQRTYQQLRGCDEFVTTIGKCQRDARDEPGKKDHKQALMQKLMQDPKNQFLPNGLKGVPLPLEPNMTMTGLNPGARIYSLARSTCA